MLKLLGQDVTNSPILCIWTEKQEDVSGSPKATWGHVTLAAELFVRFFFFSLIFTDFFPCQELR